MPSISVLDRESRFIPEHPSNASFTRFLSPAFTRCLWGSHFVQGRADALLATLDGGDILGRRLV
jgi:hypothetical protein